MDTRTASRTLATAPPRGRVSGSLSASILDASPEFDGSVQRAVPPVRLREMAAANHDPALAEASGLARNIFSLCDDSFSQEAERVVELILAGVARTSTTGR